MSAPMSPPSLDVGIVGCGKVGAVLGAALQLAGHHVVATSAISDASRERAALLLPGVPVTSVEEVVASAGVVLLTVPDDAIADLVTGLASQHAWDGGRLAVHTSGFHGIEVLDPVIEAGGEAAALHPAMTFTGVAKDLSRITGTPFAVTASPGAGLVAEALVVDLGGDPFPLADEDRAEYHFALAHSANHLVTLVAQSQQLLRGIGIDDPSRLLRPLLEAALDNALERGDKALTGPVARGDIRTVRAHLATARQQDDDIDTAYRALAWATAKRAAARRTLPAEVSGPMLDLFGSNEKDTNG
ncbi:Rossmann-like and DUF2520 domain-containing protein [Leekyejoonella antrihumi]|nr:DUF2520 domain-containing protein [Leekyejoonella antrihumi]